MTRLVQHSELRCYFVVVSVVSAVATWTAVHQTRIFLGAPSYAPGITPVRLSVCLGEGGGVRIDSLSKLPPGPKVGSGDLGI